jgi:hypothetical protein
MRRGAAELETSDVRVETNRISLIEASAGAAAVESFYWRLGVSPFDTGDGTATIVITAAAPVERKLSSGVGRKFMAVTNRFPEAAGMSRWGRDRQSYGSEVSHGREQ